MKPCLTSSLLLLLWAYTTLAQNPQYIIDSLLITLAASREDTHKVVVLNEIGTQLVNLSRHDEALRYGETALSLAGKLNYERGKARAYKSIGLVYFQKGNFPEALKNHFTSLSICETISDLLGMADAYINIANIYTHQGNPETEAYYEEALCIYTDLGLRKKVAMTELNMGVYYNKRKMESLAMEKFLSAMNILEELNDKQYLPNIYVNLGTIYGQRNNYPEALKHFKSALKIFEEKGNRAGMATIYSNLSTLYKTMGDYLTALDMGLTALHINEEIENKRGIAYAKLNIGNCYDNLFRYPEAYDAYSTALKRCEEIGDKNCLGIAHHRLGAFHTREGNFQEALQHQLKYVKLLEELGQRKNMSTVYLDIGNTYSRLGNDPKSLEAYLSALKIGEEFDDQNIIASAYNNIALIYSSQQKEEEALNYHKASLKLKEENGDKNGVLFAYANMGNIYLRQKKYEEAMECFTISLQLAEEVNNKQAIAANTDNLGTIFRKTGNYPLALEKHQVALALRQELNDVAGITASSIGIANVLTDIAVTMEPPEAQQKLDEAIRYLNKATTMAQEAGLKKTVKEAYQSLSRVYRELHDYQKALEYQSRYITLNDSLLNNETTRQLEQLRTQYEVEKAVTAEQVVQDSLLAAQKFQSEKELAERNVKHQLEIAEAKAQEERAVEAAKYRYLLQLARAKTEQERQLAEQEYQNDLHMAEESARHRIALAEEKAKQEQKEAEAEATRLREIQGRKQRAETFAACGGLLALFGLFLVMYQRQRNLKQKAIERADTIHRMTELELQSLRAQLNPHFMFNSLNAIQELILMEENDKSHTYLARFAKLLRMLLENANSPLIPLARELEFLQLYLSLEKLRIPDLEYSIRIGPDIQTEHVKIPNMILQPYIENAIWHGLSPKQGEKKLDIHVYQENENIVYEIKDNGIGRHKAAELKSLYRKEHKSKGMELLTKRFKLINTEYCSEIKTTVEDLHIDQNVSGTKVCIYVPIALQAHPELA